jgi:hypothetical protein
MLRTGLFVASVISAAALWDSPAAAEIQIAVAGR